MICSIFRVVLSLSFAYFCFPCHCLSPSGWELFSLELFLLFSHKSGYGGTFFKGQHPLGFITKTVTSKDFFCIAAKFAAFLALTVILNTIHGYDLFFTLRFFKEKYVQSNNSSKITKSPKLFNESTVNSTKQKYSTEDPNPKSTLGSS